MYGIFTYIWLIFVVNVGKYTIHGWYGYPKPLPYDQTLDLPPTTHPVFGLDTETEGEVASGRKNDGTNQGTRFFEATQWEAKNKNM